MQQQRPGTATRPPGTASGSRRPPTATASRGGGSRGRPGTSAAGAGAPRPMTRGNTGVGSNGPYSYEETEEDEDESRGWDGDEYESDDDEDVFAFVPPDLGPAPQVVTSSDPQPFGQVQLQRPDQQQQQQQQPQQQIPQPQQQQLQHSQQSQQRYQYEQQQQQQQAMQQQYQQQQQQQQQSQQQQQQQHQPMASSSSQQQLPPPPPPHADEETFYYDEQTGAVYDAQGRLVQMPAGIDTSQLSQQQQQQQPQPDPNPLTPPRRSHSDVRSHPPAVVYPPRISLDRKSSNASSYVDQAGLPRLSHANSQSFQPPYHPHSMMDPLDEVEHLNSRDGPRGGGGQWDQRGGDATAEDLPYSTAASTIRQRNNRLSNGADGPNSPASELKFRLDANNDSYAGKLVRYSSELGNGPGLAHGIDYRSGDVGPRGIKMVELEMEGDEDSPYPEVRASVSNVDDTDMPANTVRMWILSVTLLTLGAAINAVLSLRYPAPTLTPLIIQVVSYPLGKLMAAVLPITTFTLPSWLGGLDWSLNPGMFNIKEHTCVVLMANVGLLPAYALNTIVVQYSPYYYNDATPIGFAVLLTISSQLIGFGMAGVTRRFLVGPASMIWPQVLVLSTVFNTLHAEEDGSDDMDADADANGNPPSRSMSLSRFRYFTLVSLGAFVWWWFPGWIFTALSTFSFLCWIWPRSFAVNTLFGTSSGMGMSFLTFDWQLITYMTSPLVTPWWAQCNIFFGFVLFLWLIAPLLYWKNVYNFGYLPFSSSDSFDRFGKTYNVTSVITAAMGFDEQAYESYSQLYFGTTYFIVYWTGFATFTAVLVHTALYHGRTLWRGVRGVKTEEDDVHAKMMRKYPEVPDWWYLIIFVISFLLAVICTEVYDTGLPVWGLLLSVVIPVVYFLPSGFIYAQTGTTIGVNLVSELVAGYALPGKSLPNMMIKLYSQVGLTQGLAFSQDLKLAHYMKVDPRLTFAVMLFAGFWASIVHVFVNLFMRTHVGSLCAEDQEHQFTCPQAGVYFTSSVIWGIIGPERMFSNGSYYSSIYWALLAGCLAPIPLFLAARRWPQTFLKVVNVPLVFTGTASIPPAAGIVVSSWFLLGFIFQYVVRKRNFRWWSKFNFVTSAAMDTGTILSGIVVFVVLTLPRDGAIALRWWGNDVNAHTLDGSPAARLAVPTDGFAPAPSIIHAY